MTEVEQRREPAGGRRLRGLSDAVVLLCGTGHHRRGSGPHKHDPRLDDIPAVRETLTDLREVLIERCGARRPTVELDPPTAGELGDAIAAAAHRAEDTLLIYYVGHGLVDPHGDLYLAGAATRPDAPHTALRYDLVREYVKNSPAQRKIVILDCCYSGIAVGTLGDGAAIGNRAAIEGAYVLTSAGRDQASIAPPGARHTAFSGELIRVLTDGDPAAGPELTLGSVFRYLDRELPAAGYPRPRQRAIGGLHEFVLTDNPAAGGDRDGHARPPAPRRRVRVPVVLAAVLAGTAAVPFLASLLHGGDGTWPPPGVRGDVLRERWGPLVLTTTAAAAFVLTAGPVTRGVGGLVDRYQRRSSRLRHRHGLLRRLQVTLLGLVAFVLALTTGGTGLTAAAGARVWLATCPTTARVGVLVPTGSLEPARELAQAFERDTAADDFGCPDARLLVYAADAAQIRTALVNGWGAGEHVEIGPRPDVWLPDWSGETRDARATAGRIGRTLPIDEVRTVASTPLVLAVAATSTATEDGLVDTASWPQLLDTMRRRGWATVVPDPDTGVGGLARVPLYHPSAEPDVPTLSPETVERHIERSFDRGKHTLGADVGALLCAPEGIRDRTGYVVTEQAVARFNHGDPVGVDCPHRDPARLRAVYARPTPHLDREVVRFGWPSAGAERSRAAARFTAWLAGPDGAAALTAAGLRTSGGTAGPPLSAEWGVQPDLTPPPTPTSVDLVQDVHIRYARAHRAGRVLIAIDASGSMGLAAPGGSLWRVAARGAERSIGRLGPRDELGIWAFQGRQRNGVRELVPIGPRDDPVRGRPRQAAAAEALAAVRPDGPAPLFSTIVAGIAETGPTTDERVTALVLLTDGQNDNASAIGARQFRAAVSRKGVRVFAVAMGAAGCAAPVLRTVTTATGGACLEADADGVADQVETIMQAVS